MDNVFISVNRNAVDNISEISGIRTNGKIGALTKKVISSAFTSKVNDNITEIVNALKDKLDAVNDGRFVVVSLNGEQIRATLRKFNVTLFNDRIWIDVSQLTWPLLYNGQVSSRSIDVLAKHFKVDVKTNPDSADDCSTIAQIYGQVMQRYSTALVGEEAIRDIGGEALEGLRKIVGF